MVFKFPHHFTSKNAYSIWVKVSKILGQNITIDLRNLEYIDVEGTNYIIILPFLITKNDCKTQILLPDPSKDVYTFLSDCGVIEILQNNFTTTFQSQLPLFQNSFSYNKKRPTDGNKYIPHFKSLLLLSTQHTQIFRQLSATQNEFTWNINLSSRAARCLSELIKNIYDHSEQQFGCITMNFRNIGKQQIPSLFICITDLGIGIKKSLTKSKDYNTAYFQRRGDNYYIGEALSPGVSSTDKNSRGIGLPLVLKESNKLIISSGCCRASLTKDDKNLSVIKKSKIKRITRMRGTSIVCLIKAHEI